MQGMTRVEFVSRYSGGGSTMRMADFVPTHRLTHEASQKMLDGRRDQGQ